MERIQAIQSGLVTTSMERPEFHYMVAPAQQSDVMNILEITPISSAFHVSSFPRPAQMKMTERNPAEKSATAGQSPVQRGKGAMNLLPGGGAFDESA